jgi:hypothetical protein
MKRGIWSRLLAKTLFLIHLDWLFRHAVSDTVLLPHFDILVRVTL